MIIGLPLLISSTVVYRLSGYKPGHVGLKLGRDLPLQLLVAVGGVGLGYLEYLILRPEPLVESFTLQSLWLPALILLVFTGFLEEWIFRGLMQRASVSTLQKYGPWYISLLFAVLHIGYKSWIDLIFVFLVGFIFSLVVQRTRSLVGVTLAHGLTNISLFLIFPFVLATPLIVEAPAVPPAGPPPAPISGPAMWQSQLQLTPLATDIPVFTATSTPEGTATFTPTWTASSTFVDTADCDAVCHRLAYTQRHPYRHAGRLPHPHAHAYAHAHRDGHPDIHANPVFHLYLDADQDSDPDSHPASIADRHTDSAADGCLAPRDHADHDAHPDGCAAPRAIVTLCGLFSKGCRGNIPFSNDLMQIYHA